MNKAVITRLLVEVKKAGYLGELVQSGLSILSEAGFIPASCNNPKLAQSIEHVLQSELFDVFILKAAESRSVHDGSRAPASGWTGPVGGQGNTPPARPPA
jgi:hypothetical protein